MIPHPADIHGTDPQASPAAGAVFFLHPDAQQGDPGKEAIDSPQRAQETAKGAIEKNACGKDQRHNDDLMGKQRPQHAVFIRVDGIGKQAHGSFQGTGGADVFAEGGQRHPAESVTGRNDHHKNDQKDILEPGQEPGDPVLFDFVGGHAMQKLLDHAKGAQPAADYPTQGQAEEQQQAYHIEGRPVGRGGNGVLQRPQRARGNGPGAGIAIETGHAKGFEGAGIDGALPEALDMGVIEQHGIELHQPPPGRPMRLPPGDDLIQGRYTPYRFGWPSPARREGRRSGCPGR